MLEAVRTASRVLNSCGQVLPATLSNIVLVAELEDGRTIRGESQIPAAGGRIRKLNCDPAVPRATPEAVEAILSADLIIIGPGSLYTSIIPNLLIQGIPESIKQSQAKKLYVCNVMTQEGETNDYSVADHVQAVLGHAGGQQRGNRLLNAVLVNEQLPVIGDDPESQAKFGSARPVRYDPDRLREMSVVPVRRSLINPTQGVHHNPHKLAKVIIAWYNRKRPKRILDRSGNGRGPGGGSRVTQPADKSSASAGARDKIASTLSSFSLLWRRVRALLTLC